MKVLITGARGQLGTELILTAPAGVQLIATDVENLDITDRAQVKTFVAETKPDLIINAAAYTAVDKAESESELAFRINRDGAAHLAEAANTQKARFFQISTDYVFDGTKPAPYKPDDTPNPVNVYGLSKLAGEKEATERTDGAALIVRTAWVYSTTGSNFVKTMLRLMRERDELRVVCDQIGTPTHAAGLASALWKFAGVPGGRGMYHWTDAGVASWYDFAEAIQELAMQRGLKPSAKRLLPISSADYPTPARRPLCCILDKTSTWGVIGNSAHWRTALANVIGVLCAPVN